MRKTNCLQLKFPLFNQLIYPNKQNRIQLQLIVLQCPDKTFQPQPEVPLFNLLQAHHDTTVPN